MSSVTLTRRHRGRRGRPGSALVSTGLAIALALGAAACSGDDDEQATGGAGPGSAATDPAPVSTEITLKNLGKDVPDATRAQIKDGVGAALDPWLDGAFLGDFPRSDYAPAFASFTKDAAKDAEGRDLALLSNQAIGDQIDSATATRRRVRLEVFSHDGKARGATAYVVLDFDTDGALAESRRVNARLYLVQDAGAWRVFGYDVAKAVTL